MRNYLINNFLSRIRCFRSIFAEKVLMSAIFCAILDFFRITLWSMSSCKSVPNSMRSAYSNQKLRMGSHVIFKKPGLNRINRHSNSAWFSFHASILHMLNFPVPSKIGVSRNAKLHDIKFCYLKTQKVQRKKWKLSFLRLDSPSFCISAVGKKYIRYGCVFLFFFLFFLHLRRKN